MIINVKKKTIWISWERQIRNRSMAKGLNIPLFEIIAGQGRVIRYFYCIHRTLAIIRRERPIVAICQNPSLVLTLFLLSLRFFFRFKVCIDAHFGGVEDCNGSQILQKLLDCSNRAADLVIVTNKEHSRQIKSLGGKTFVSPDPLPDLSEYSSQTNEIHGKVFCICSFDVDEPVQEFLRAAKILQQKGFLCYISGDYTKAKLVPEDFPHVKMLGFLSEREYYIHLFSSQVVVVLTDFDNCLVCGGYEAMSACKPTVLSKKRALQEYFTSGTVFTDNLSEKIAVSVKKAHSNRLLLRDECRRWVSKEKEKRAKRLKLLRSILERL